MTWLRIHHLADRLRQVDFGEEADLLENNWQTIAEALGVKEDYYGFYEDEFLPPIRWTIDDMLIEAQPYQFTENDISSSEWDAHKSSPVHLFNKAWLIFSEEPAGYQDWERQAVSDFLKER